jgi:hypothetical protein
MTNGAYILAAIQSRPCTCDEAERMTGLAHQVCSARMRDLAKSGAIVRTGKRRPTRLGRMAAEWRAV